MALISSCGDSAGKKETEITESKNEQASIDYKANGLIDLGESTSIKEIICQDWENKEDAADAEDVNPTSNPQIELQYRGYCFYGDGSVVKDPRGFVKTGKWRLIEEEKPISIAMEFNDGENLREVVGPFTPTKLILAGKKDIKSPAAYIARAFRHINMKDDPFYPANIWWMIKPAKPETDGEIKQRFKACLHFFYLFYKEYTAVPPKKVSFVGLPSCYNWYVGGIILQREKNIQQKWINCFYNEEQAMKAYKLADKLVSKKYDWGQNEGRWMKRSMGVLLQMEKRLDSIN